MTFLRINFVAGVKADGTVEILYSGADGVKAAATYKSARDRKDFSRIAWWRNPSPFKSEPLKRKLTITLAPVDPAADPASGPATEPASEADSPLLGDESALPVPPPDVAREIAVAEYGEDAVAASERGEAEEFLSSEQETASDSKGSGDDKAGADEAPALAGPAAKKKK